MYSDDCSTVSTSHFGASPVFEEEEKARGFLNMQGISPTTSSAEGILLPVMNSFGLWHVEIHWLTCHGTTISPLYISEVSEA
jgi:hypothetical protein